MTIWLMLFACAGSRDDLPVVETASIVAADGGVITLPDGATLTIPPGALAADGEVAFTRVTCGGVYSLKSFGGCLYSVGDAAWAGRFEVALPRRGDDRVQMVRGAPDGLRPLIDSTSDGDLLSATSSGSNVFTSRVADYNPVDQRCDDVPFTPCGGDLEGTWHLVRACGSVSELTGISWEGPNPFAACADHDYMTDYPFTVDGSVEFGAEGSSAEGGTSGAFWATNSATILKHEMVSLACMAIVDGGSSCQAECVQENGVCDCTYFMADGSGGREGAWEYADEGTITVDGTPNRYCVAGDGLTIEYVGAEGPYVMIYER